MRRFAVKNLLLQLFWGYPKNGHKMTGLIGGGGGRVRDLGRFFLLFKLVFDIV